MEIESSCSKTAPVAAMCKHTQKVHGKSRQTTTLTPTKKKKKTKTKFRLRPLRLSLNYNKKQEMNICMKLLSCNFISRVINTYMHKHNNDVVVISIRMMILSHRCYYVDENDHVSRHERVREKMLHFCVYQFKGMHNILVNNARNGRKKTRKKQQLQKPP